MPRISYVVVFWAWTNLLFGQHSVTAYAETPESYQKAAEAFMHGQAEELGDLISLAQGDARELTPEQRKALVEMRRASVKMKPRWWDRTRSTSNVSFKADMWGRAFSANYIPSDILGMQAPIGVRNNRLVVVVTWRPAFIDNPKPLEGWLAEKHGLTQGDLGEVIVWHELGHNYITLNLHVRQALELYRNHEMLFHHVQEFYADLTALRHASPKAARTTLMFRTRELSSYDEREAHTRAAHGLGALMLSEWLENPEKWPMVHFPPKVPATNVELETLKYVYQHFDPEWSPEEYFAMQDFIDRWVRRNGDRVLKGKGHIRLPNRQEMMLVASDDREMQPKRDAWVAERLAKLIEDGRADKPEKQEEPDLLRAELMEHGYWDGIVIPW
jgi:hypothetical protein